MHNHGLRPFAWVLLTIHGLLEWFAVHGLSALVGVATIGCMLTNTWINWRNSELARAKAGL